MIRVLILYYLSIKPTHGYEIQKFIQVNHLNQWTKIQSGSIYYALNKLEEQKLIELESEAGGGQKAKKTYRITEDGRSKLRQLVEKELDKDISTIGSDKFIVYPILNGLDEKVIAAKINDHIKNLSAKKSYLETWKDAKVSDNSLKVEALSFEMMISNVNYQILWHEALLEELPECMKKSDEISELIRSVDFSELEPTERPVTNKSDTSLEGALKNFTKNNFTKKNFKR